MRKLLPVAWGCGWTERAEATSSADALFEPQKGLDIPPIVLKQRTPRAQDPMGLREKTDREKENETATFVQMQRTDAPQLTLTLFLIKQQARLVRK